MGREKFLLTDGIGGGESRDAGLVGSLPVSSLPPEAVGVCFDGGEKCILHTVSKFDTLAGVAIKYGVEVADIKRVNGLVTDLQMFALKTLQIPLPGRHPPSPCLSNGGYDPPRQNSSQQYSSLWHSDFVDSFPSLKLKSSSDQKVSSAMIKLQGYYGLRSAGQNAAAEGGPHYPEDGDSTQSSPTSLSQQRRSKGTADTPSNDSDKSDEKVRRRQKSVGDFTSQNPEKIEEEEDEETSNSTALTNKGLGLKSKSTSVAVCGGGDGESGGGQSPVPTGFVDSFLTSVVSIVRKSSSATNLPDSENRTLSSIWPKTNWRFKPDFEALVTLAIARPIFDGLARPTNRRNKAAMD